MAKAAFLKIIEIVMYAFFWCLMRILFYFDKHKFGRH